MQFDLNGKFPPTQWDLVEDAADPVHGQIQAHRLDDLLKLYMPPLLAHLVLAKRIPRHQAEDLLQGFLATKILQQNFLSRADRKRGKFRTFLLTSLNNHVISEFRKAQSQRRAPGAHPLLSLDVVPDQEEQRTVPDASRVFDLAWSREVIREVLRRVAAECRRTHRSRYWKLFEDRLVNPVLQGTTPTPYAVMVKRLGFSSPIQAANAVFSVKRMFERFFREVVAEYAGDENTVEREIRELYAILADHGA
jgi:RNA polymerase sigma-70 factor (ECF subfamily)